MSDKSKPDKSKPDTSAAMPNRFEGDTRVERVSEGRYAASMNKGWWVINGPNGGYIAAVLLRALLDAVDDETRIPRTLTLHYLRPPLEGGCEIETQIEREGRTLTTGTARMMQNGKLMVLAIGAFSTPRTGAVLEHAVMPEVAPPEELEPSTSFTEMARRYDGRFLGGQPREAVRKDAFVAAWFRLAEPEPVGYPLLAALTDALPPAIFATGQDPMALRGVPTVELTVHFRSDLRELDLAPDEFFLCIFRSRTAREGFIEEDGEIWTRSGHLIAQSRQLAIVGTG